MDLMSLISHHLVRDYDISIFHEDPDLAAPLLADFNRIEEERREEQRKRYSKAFTKANKKFDWSTIKKDDPKSEPASEHEEQYIETSNQPYYANTKYEVVENKMDPYMIKQTLPNAPSNLPPQTDVQANDKYQTYKPKNTYVKKENKQREYNDVSFDRFNRSNTYVPKQTSTENIYRPKSVISSKLNKEFDWLNRKNK
jgi:hypothetical protein